MKWSLTLAAEYRRLWEGCAILRTRAGEVSMSAARLLAHRERYVEVGMPIGVPWTLVAVVHELEAGRRWDRHLHNGDPLTARTVRVPRGRPMVGMPPFTWEDSARDALLLHAWDAVPAWTLPRALFELERFNGWGYRRHGVWTPYLWAGSQYYQAGKYVADGQWSATAVSQQVGAAVLLKHWSLAGTDIGVRDA